MIGKHLLPLTLGMAIAAAPAPPAAAAPRWTSTLNETTGLPMLQASGTSTFTASFAFWGPNWSWANLAPAVRKTGDGKYQVSGRNAALGVTMTDDVARGADGAWTSDFLFQDGAGLPSVSGGGIVFRFALEQWAPMLGEPELLPDNQGWRWGRGGGPQVEMRFDPPLAAAYFEQGDKSQLRAFFFNDKIPPGDLRHRMTWVVKGGVENRATLGERLNGKTAPAAWPVDALSNAGPLPDLSFLNDGDKPAGKRGPVHAADGALAFADGTPARFWGANVTAYALFSTPRDDVRRQAARLASLGYNLVRIHHMDSGWVGFNVFGQRAALKDTQTLDEKALERLDWWIKCLEDEGISVWLDLHVERQLRAGDRIDAFDEISKGKDTAGLKGFNYVNASIRQAMKRFNEAYLGHRNVFNGLAYKDDPAVVGVLLTNENDLTQHFGNGFLPDKKVPWHGKVYMDAAAAFAGATGLPKDKVWRSWEPGPSKMFLNDLEHRFDIEMMADLRKNGARMPVATTSTWANNPLYSLPSLTTGDLVDVHSYSYYGALEKNPAYTPNIADWLGAAHVLGHPMSVTEWNADPFPTQDRHVLPLYIAATASHQGWDALMHFAYTQEPTSANHPSNWNSYNDPSLLAMMPAAALLFRERHVAEATTTYVFDPGADALYGKAISAANSVALRTAIERGKLLIAMPPSKELPWLRTKPAPRGAVVLRDPGQSQLPADAAQASSDTGELVRNWDDGVFTIDTPRTRAAMGWIGGRTIALPDVSIAMETPNASVAVQSLDGKPIEASSDLLISIGTRSQPQANNKAPFLSEPAVGVLKIKAVPGLEASTPGADGDARWPSTYQSGAYTIRLDGKLPTHWLALRRANAPPRRAAADIR
ncbi:MAG: hypothetical protein ABW032_00980 [Burkholderiaceae bacterium]